MFDWQTWVAVGLTTVAAIALLRRVRNWVRGVPEGGCGSCPSNTSSSPKLQKKQLVQIDTEIRER